MNYNEMATFVRAQADTDTTDAPDSILQVHANAAYQDIVARVFPWPDKKVAYTFATVVDDASYPLSGLSGTDMEFVVSVASSDDVLMYVSPEQYRSLTVDLTGSGTPTVYTVDSGVIYLWPTPSGVATFNVSGFRRFATWVFGATEPDLPRGFDEAICWYMLARYYQSQEDLDLTQMYMADYERSVNQQMARSLRSSSASAGPMIFGGDPRLPFSRSYSDWVKRSVEG
jgi:hypothetical protein